MILVYNEIIPPKEWIHDPNITNKNNKTVADILKEEHLPIPNEWYDNNMKDVERKSEFV